VELRDAVVVITGGAGGIGAALAHRFASEGARRLVLVDLDADRARAVAAAVGDVARGVGCDVSDPDAVAALVADVEADDGPIDLFCSNAGIATGEGVEASVDVWQRTWEVNVLSQVAAARALVPGWLARGGGYLLVTASAAGLLTNLGDAPYTATKHAAVGLAEWLAITYGGQGVKVSCLCPQGVRTPMLFGALSDGELAAEVVRSFGVIEPEVVAEAVVVGLRDERFLILPHPEVREYVVNKAADHDRWLAGMRKVQARLAGGA
jgi:NAD(P)-dependent dehydrogenase (short-subunit alcohol dehydrogenase family)